VRSLDRVIGWVNFQHTGIWGEAAAQNLSNLRDKSGNHTSRHAPREWSSRALSFDPIDT
jgi:hypothetical protein